MAKKRALALAVQAVCMAALGALTALLALFLGGRALPAARVAAVWLVSALVGAWLALRAARLGVPAILAWPLGPAAWAVACFLTAGMSPPPGGALWIALCSVVGASAGEVLFRRAEKKG